MQTILSIFDRWKQYLGEQVTQAERSGMSEQVINKLAYQLGEFLAKNVDPKNDQERLLKDLWDVASEDEQKVIAKLMVRLVDK
jgi:hypothetical protein